MAGGRLVGVAEAGTVMSRAVAVYRMNPAEDKIIFGDELAGGMWALADNPEIREPDGDSEDERIRQPRFPFAIGPRPRVDEPCRPRA
jgi:hypothetical protein